MNAGLFALVFVFGGLFLSVESVAQSTVAQYHATAPSGSSWVTTSQANQTVNQQIVLLTGTVNNLVQGGADDKLIRLAKQEMLMWVYIQQNLAQGMPVGTALEVAFQRMSAGKGMLVNNNDPNKQGKLQEWYDKAIELLTV